MIFKLRLQIPGDTEPDYWERVHSSRQACKNAAHVLLGQIFDPSDELTAFLYRLDTADVREPISLFDPASGTTVDID